MLKTLGQVRPGAATAVKLYTVPPNKGAVLANIIACNTDLSAADTFAIYQVPATITTPTTSHQIASGNIPASESYIIVAGISLAADPAGGAVGESIYVISGSGKVTFTCSGDES